MRSPGEGAAFDELALAPELMRELAARAVDLVVARISNLPSSEPWKGASREELEALLDGPAPESGCSPHEVLERAMRDILPIAARVDHPRFFAFVPGSPTWPGILADFISAGHNIFQGTWLGSGGPSQLELTVIDWFRTWFGYPETAGGLFTSGGSAASLDAFVAAREAAGAPERATVYMSDQSHTALLRAATIVGVRRERVRMVATDEEFRLDLDALSRAVSEDRAAGLHPIAVCANACEREGVWMHVDAAYGGFAILTEVGQRLFRGIERADSIAVDAHKWLFQPFETGCLLVKDVRALERAFSVRPEYLQDTEWGDRHPNFGDRGLQLSRSFRALKVWMSIQTFGLGAFRRTIANGIELAARAEVLIRDSRVLRIANPASLGVVCFRIEPDGIELDEGRIEEINETVQSRVIESGMAMMSSTRLRGRYSLRFCILNHGTTWDDVRETLEAIERLGLEVSRA